MPSTVQSGSQGQEDQLAHIGMEVGVARTVEVSGVPVTGAPATSIGLRPMHTVTHQEVRGVVVSVLDGLLSGQQPSESEREMTCMR